VTSFEGTTRELRATAKKALVIYVMAGLDGWLDAVRAAHFAGADIIEVGVPLSDPIMDGPVIQAAATESLSRGTTFSSVMAELATAQLDVPVVAMTYFNIFHHAGLGHSVELLASAGVVGTIVPDLSLEESEPWRQELVAAISRTS
jgi:tryptophan synthase alpha chain